MKFFDCLYLLAIVSVRATDATFAENGEFPYIVSLQDKVKRHHFCSGSLLNANYILTACQCFGNFIKQKFIMFWPRDFVAVGGSYDLKSKNIQIRVLETGYRSTNCDKMNIGYVNDFAIYKTVKSFKFSDNLKSLDLPYSVIRIKEIKCNNLLKVRLSIHEIIEKAVEKNKICYAIGWRNQFVVDPSNITYSKHHLEKTIVKLISDEECKKLFCNNNTSKHCAEDLLHRRIICAVPPKPINECYWDSGGPLICDKQFYALASWGPSCGEAQLPVVFSSIVNGVYFLKDVWNNGYKVTAWFPVFFCFLIHI